MWHLAKGVDQPVVTLQEGGMGIKTPNLSFSSHSDLLSEPPVDKPNGQGSPVMLCIHVSSCVPGGEGGGQGRVTEDGRNSDLSQGTVMVWL